MTILNDRDKPSAHRQSKVNKGSALLMFPIAGSKLFVVPFPLSRIHWLISYRSLAQSRALGYFWSIPIPDEIVRSAYLLRNWAHMRGPHDQSLLIRNR